jgi:2,3-dihydroxyphenylpropionate 1,2-dioxygenase
MGKVVAAVGMSHAPGALAFPETCPSDIRKKLEDSSLELGKSLGAGKPDVIFAFLDDHFENFIRNHMPSIAIGVADSHVGPADQWMETVGTYVNSPIRISGIGSLQYLQLLHLPS